MEVLCIIECKGIKFDKALFSRINSNCKCFEYFSDGDYRIYVTTGNSGMKEAVTLSAYGDKGMSRNITLGKY